MEEQITITCDTAQLNRLTKKLALYYGEPKGFYKIFERWYFGEMRRAYATEGAHIGARWPKLTDDYFKQKKKDGYPGRAHMLTGRTRKALTGGRGGGRRVRKTRKVMEIGLGAYPGFRDTKHQTVHPFYIIDHSRPLQHKAPTRRQMIDLDKDIQQDIEQFDRKVGTR